MCVHSGEKHYTLLQYSLKEILGLICFCRDLFCGEAIDVLKFHRGICFKPSKCNQHILT